MVDVLTPVKAKELLSLAPNTTVDTLSSASVNNYAPTQSRSILIVNPTLSTGVTITGMVAPTPNGQIVALVNAGTAPLTLSDENASSTAANRFALVGDLLIYPDSACLLYYDTTASRWRALAQASSGSNDVVTIGASKILAFGHSYLTGAGPKRPDGQFITLLSGLLRTDLVDLGVGGAGVSNDETWLGDATNPGGWAWVLQQVVPYGIPAGAPYVPDQFFPFLVYGLNDVNHAHDATGAPRTIFKAGLRTVLSRTLAARVFEDDDASIAYGGATAWQKKVLDTKRNSGSGYRPIPANGATITHTLTADYDGSRVGLGLTVWPAGDGQIVLTGTAGATGTFSLAGLAYHDGGTGIRRDSSNGHVIRVTGLTSANAGQTIIATYSAGAGTAFSSPAQPGALTVNGTIGATTYGYKRVYLTYNGETIPSTERTIATGNGTLTGTNSITIPAGAAWPSGVVAELVVRTTGGANNGNQGTIAILAAPAAVTDIGSGPFAFTANTVQPLTGGAAFDYVQYEAVAARGAIANINRITNYAGMNGAGDADIANYNTDITSVVAEFGANQWVVSDIYSLIGTAAANFNADGRHPNDTGSELIAAKLYADIAFAQLSAPMSTQAAQARVMKRVTSRAASILKPTTSSAVSGDPIAYLASPMNGQIAAASLPFAGTGTADYQLDSTVRVLDTTNLTKLLEASPGDDIEVEFMAFATAVAQVVNLDAAFLGPAGAVLRYFSAAIQLPTTFAAGYQLASEAVQRAFFAKWVATVTASDLIVFNSVPGQVRVAVVGQTGAGNRVIFGGGTRVSTAAYYHVKNVGRRNVGFNTS